MVNSPEHSKLQVLAFKVATLIDEDDEIVEFNELIEHFISDENVIKLVQGLKTLIRKPARLQLFDDVRRVVPLRLQMEYNLRVPYTSNRTRNVRLLRRGPPALHGFGFSIRGGREHGTGFFVSAVDVNSEAHHQGLRIGDQIVRINGFSVEDAIHQEVLHLIQSYNHLNLKVRSVGMIPVKDKKHDPLTWQMVDGKSPPLSSGGKTRPLIRTISEGSILEGPSTFDEARDVKLFLDTTNHPSLGVSICKGNEQRPGIFVQGVREGGLACEAGLLTGDQIIECNGVNFENIPFEEAVRTLKSSKQLDLLVRKGSGLEMFGESSGYNSSSSSVNGDSGDHSDKNKRLSLITEDPGEEGERSRSNSRRGADEMMPVLTEHSETVQERRVVSAQVHHAPEEERNAHYPLEHSSSGSSMSSLSSALSNEVKRRSERREEENVVASQQRRDEDRRRRELALKTVPEERRQKHAMQLMQEFQQVHRKMFTGTTTHAQHTTVVTQEHQERFQNVTYNNGESYTTVQNGTRARPTPLSPREAEVASVALAATPTTRRGVEMNSIDTITLNSPTSNKPKPPAVYFGAGASSKSQPGVVTISEYPNSDRRAPPSRLDFLSASATIPEHVDTQEALASELQNTLSRSNLRQLSEPVTAPPPPPEMFTPPHSPNAVMNGGHNSQWQEDEQQTNPILEMRRVKTKVTAVNAFRRPQSQSPPPVIALKPLAVPYTELVTKKNQHQSFLSDNEDNPNQSSTPPQNNNYNNNNNNEIQKINSNDDNKNIKKTTTKTSSSTTRNTEYTDKSSLIMDTLSNKVTIKFPNGESASAGTKNLNALMATDPVVTSNTATTTASGILKQHGKPKHRTVIHQKSITFGEITTVMCVQVQDC